MSNFIEKNYRFLVIIGIASIAVLSFLVGQNTSHAKSSVGVALNCSDEVLSKLALNSTGSTSATSLDTQTKQIVAPSTKGSYLGSKNGTKYYTPGCSGANRIKPENIIWFNSSADAQLQGYSEGSC